MKPNLFLHSKNKFTRLLLGLFVLTAPIFACNQKPNAETESVQIQNQKSDSVRKKYTADMVDNKKDPSCGMPLTAGIEDTVHYNGKVYGFCSDECKQIFLKDPKTLAKNAEMKN
jgi:YHS domain-containing protein